MRFHWLQALRALILLAFSAFIFMLHQTGDIVRFINPQYVIFSQVASVIFLFLFFIQALRIWKDTSEDNEEHSNCGPWGCNHETGYNQPFTIKMLISYMIILVPIVTGFVLPTKELDASIATKRGVYIHSSQLELENCNDDHFHAALYQPMDNQQVDLLNKPIIKLDKNNFASYLSIISKNPERFKGKPIQLEGFLLKDETLEDHYWVIARFLVTHCVADASVLGAIIEMEKDTTLEENTWVMVQGILQVSPHNGSNVASIKVVNWKEINQSKDPYIYPGKHH